MLTQRRIRKQVSLYLQPGQNFDATELLNILSELLELKRFNEQLLDPNHPAAQMFDQDWQQGDPDWAKLQAQIDWMDRFVKRLGESAQTTFSDTASQTIRQFAEHSTGTLDPADDHGKTVASYLAHLLTLSKTLETLAQSGNFDMRFFTGQPDRPDMLGMIHRLSTRYPKHVDQLNDWSYWQRVRASAIQLNLKALVNQHEQGHIPTDMIKSALQRTVLDAWINATWKMDPILNSLNIHEHVQRIEHFKQLDRAHLKLSQHKVRDALSESVPSQQIAANLSNSEMGLLAHQLKLKRCPPGLW